MKYLNQLSIPSEIKYPAQKPYKIEHADKYGTYQCTDWFRCITNHDFEVLKQNYTSIEDAHKRLLYKVEEHNREVESLYRENPDMVKCGALDFKCRAWKANND